MSQDTFEDQPTQEVLIMDVDPNDYLSSDEERSDPRFDKFGREALHNQTIPREVSNYDVYPHTYHDEPIRNVDSYFQPIGSGKQFETLSRMESPGITAAELVVNLPHGTFPKSSPGDIIIPTGIREIMYDLPNPVLDVNTLEKLFNHTRKKSNVQMIIRNHYTTNIEGLRQQLNETVTNYYQPPISNTKEDRDFVKWIEKFLTRF